MILHIIYRSANTKIMENNISTSASASAHNKLYSSETKDIEKNLKDFIKSKHSK